MIDGTPQTDLHIAKRLKDLLPGLKPEERKQLKENIEEDGRVLDAILYWNDGKKNVVVDGMHRWDVVKGTDIPYATEPMDFESYEDAELWILNHQLGRRNLLDPASIRKIRGELYNRLKRKDGGHGNQKSGGQNVPPIQNAAHIVGSQAGVSEKTVKRDGARMDAFAKLTPAAKKQAEKATDAEIKSLAKLTAPQQNAVARAVRTGQQAKIKDAIKEVRQDQPAKAPKKSNGQPPKQFDNSALFKQWESQMSKLVRFVDKAAKDVGKSKTDSHKTVQDHLNLATEEMMEMLGVKK